jgi:uncharacterized phosphosugar-binding protein
MSVMVNEQSFPSEYLKLVNSLIGRLIDGQLGAIGRAASLIASAIANGGRVWIAESDHILASEATYRAGGFVAVDRLGVQLDADGIGTLTFQAESTGPTPLDVVVLASGAGADRRSVELAHMCRGIGMSMIVLASEEFATTADVVSRHPSGLKLRDFAQVLIDIGGRAGDAAVDVPGVSEAICPTSGVISVAAMWAVFAKAAAVLVGMGLEPLVFRSVASEGGEELYRQLELDYATLGLGYRNPSIRTSDR